MIIKYHNEFGIHMANHNNVSFSLIENKIVVNLGAIPVPFTKEYESEDIAEKAITMLSWWIHKQPFMAISLNKYLDSSFVTDSYLLLESGYGVKDARV